MYNNEDVIVISSSDEETTFIPNKKRLLNNMLVVPGESSSHCPVVYWRPEDLGYTMQVSFEDTDVTGKELAITSKLDLQKNMNKVIIAKKNLDKAQDQQNDWSIASSSGLERAHYADPGENNAVDEDVPLDLRKFVDKQKQNKIDDSDDHTDNSQDVEDTQSINETEETNSQISDISTAVFDIENNQSQPIDVVGIGNSSYSENESTFDCRVGHAWYSIQNSSENKEIDETILVTSSDDEVDIM